MGNCCSAGGTEEEEALIWETRTWEVWAYESDEEGEQQKEILSEGESWECPRCGAEWDSKPASAQCLGARLGAPFTL